MHVNFSGGVEAEVGEGLLDVRCGDALDVV